MEHAWAVCDARTSAHIRMAGYVRRSRYVAIRFGVEYKMLVAKGKRALIGHF